MARGKSTFKQDDVARALRAMQAAAFDGVLTIEAGSGNLRITPAHLAPADAPKAPTAPRPVIM